MLWIPHLSKVDKLERIGRAVKTVDSHGKSLKSVISNYAALLSLLFLI